MATKPTIALIPSGYGTNKVYSVLPSDGSGDFTFGRTGTATRINKDKLIESVGSNIPRLDYTDSGCPSLLLEPQRTNSILQSNQFDTTWTLLNSSVVANQNGIYNSLDAWKLVGNGSNNDKVLQNVPSGTSTFSIYAKVGNQNFTVISLGNAFAYFNIETGVVTSTSGVVSTNIESIGNKWYRLSITVALSSSSNVQVYIASANGSVVTNNGDFIYIQHAQLEVGSNATSIIPTTGTTVTRIGETANSSGNASTFNDSEGVLMVQASRQEGSVVNTCWSINNGALANSINLYYGSTNSLYFDIFSGSTTVSGNININTYNLNKIALKYKSGDISLYFNGFELVTKTNVISLSGLKDLDFNFGAGNQPFFGKTKQVQYFNTALTDLELETLTSFTSFNAMALNFNYTIY